MKKPAAMRTYDVTVIVKELDYQETFSVQAQDEWKARTVAMFDCTAPLMGQFVDYVVKEQGR